MVDHPRDLGRGEIGVEQQTSLGPHQRFGALISQPRANFGSAAVLPDDRAMDRLSCRAVPDDDCFALIGDADAGDTARINLTENLANDGQGVAPDLLRVMLYPATRGIM